jgi:hypothetical protein
MAGDSDWVEDFVTLEAGGQTVTIASSYLASQPDIRLYFLRLPDGFGDGTGSGTYGNQSLEQLWHGEIDTITAVDETASYSAAELTALLTELINLHTPGTLHIQDHTSEHAGIEHSDHLATAEIATQAGLNADAPLNIVSYHGYATWGFEENLFGADHDLVRDVFLEYAAHDPMVFGSDGQLIISYEEWVQREYVAEQYSTADAAQALSDPAAFYEAMMRDTPEDPPEEEDHGHDHADAVLA